VRALDGQSIAGATGRVTFRVHCAPRGAALAQTAAPSSATSAASWVRERSPSLR
jgi:hypothetical protein